MRLKIYASVGLIFLIINQLMLLKGDEFIQTQRPIDYAHWLLLIGVLLTLSLNYIFSDTLFGNTAAILTSIGTVALVGQATIDFIWWSYGTDYKGMNDLTNQIMDDPSIRIPFVTIGPALFYLGLAIHAGVRIKKTPIWSVLALIGVVVTGIGSFYYHSRATILLGHVVLAAGIIGLIFKRTIPNLKHRSGS